MHGFLKNNHWTNISTYWHDHLSHFEKIVQKPLIRIHGRVLELTSLIIRASIPSVSIGEICKLSVNGSELPLFAQVVGFREDDVFLMPFGDTSGLGPNSQVTREQKTFTLKVGYELLGRTLNGLGQAIDEKESLSPDLCDWPLNRGAPDPYKRRPIKEALPLGIRAIDSLMTVGKGQRIGLFSGSGVGKSSLMAEIVKNTAAKIIVVCLVGERGREVMEFINEALSEESRKKCVMVVATSDSPSLVRYLSSFVATAIAEWFRDQGEDVLLLMDSVTRFARAQREIGLALGEPPARLGFPPSVFAEIPKLLERTGTNEHGSITALYTVLVQGSDFEEPIADELRGILDGHIYLDRTLAENGHWPAISVLPSLSRVMNNIVDAEHKKSAMQIRRLISIYEKHRDLILLQAYKPGTDEQIDLAIRKMPLINDFLQQPKDFFAEYNESIKALHKIAA